MRVSLVSTCHEHFIVMSTAETFQKLGGKHSSILNDLKSGFCGVPSVSKGFREDAFCSRLQHSSSPNIRSEGLVLVGVLPGTGRILCGVAVLSAELFVVRNFSSVIDVYDVRTTLCPRRRHDIAGLRDPVDIAACPNQRALYVSGSNDRSVFRIDGSGQVLGRWLLDSRPFGISVCGQSGTICVTFLDEAMVKEFSPDGAELRAIRLDADLLSNPWHAIALPLDGSRKGAVRAETVEEKGEEEDEEDSILLVCHGWTKDRLNSVSLVNGADGRVMSRYGGQRGSGSGFMDLPSHIHLECSRGDATRALVVDLNNSRILRLKVPELGVGGGGAETVLSDSNGLKWPRSVAVDEDQGRMYVGLHEGQVLIFDCTR